MLRAAALGLFVVGWIPVFALRSERFYARRAVATAVERRWMWITAGAVTLHVTLAEVTLRRADAHALPAARIAIAMIVFAIGLTFWARARRALVAYGRRLDPTQAPPALVTIGPFAVVRHPLALGMVLLALGPALAAATIPTWTTFATVVVALAQRCRLDEIELRATFGDAYGRYAADTARLVPFLW